MRPRARLGLFLGLVAPTLFVGLPALAQNQKTDGQIAIQTTTQLYCGLFSIMNGKIGLFVGFSVALYGLYLLIENANMRGIYIIVCGALLTALPNIVIGGIQGTAAFLQAVKISSPDKKFIIPKC